VSARERLARIAWWTAAPAACLILYHYGLRTWFHQDDFAWLGQADYVATWRDWLDVLFRPQAQGTIRPWSERLYFVTLRALFGLDPLPFRIVAFLTMFANLALLQSIVLRATKSGTAGLTAALLWVGSIGLATPLGWSSSYNQLLCAFFLLLALWFRQRGRLALEWVTFLLGFGALEIGVVYPALALAYSWIYERERWRETLPMFGASAVYAFAHRSLAPPLTEGPYAMHWDGSMAQTFISYLQTGLTGSFTHPRLYWMGPWARPVAGLAAGALAVVYLARAAWKRNWSPWFGAAWFVIVLSPVLPLRDHVMEYYLATAGVGLAWLGGCAARDAITMGWPGRVATAATLAVCLLFSGLSARGTSRWRHERGRQVEVLVGGLVRAHELFPNRAILLTGVSTDLFWSGVFDRPWRLYGTEAVYLAPGAEKSIEKHPELGDMAQFMMPEGIAARLLENDGAVVYEVLPDRLRNVTGRYAALAYQWKSQTPRFVDAGTAAFRDLLGPTWYRLDQDHRWMGREATVRLGGPETRGKSLWIKGFCPAEYVRAQPIRLSVEIEGKPLGSYEVTVATSSFEFAIALPDELVGRSEILVRLTADRTFVVEGDGRDLSVVFGTFSIR
jgi:hypothetical protein